MQKVFPSNKKKFSISFNVATLVPQKMKVQAFDSNRPYSYYYGTAGNVDSKGRDFDLVFPLSPDKLTIRIFPDRFKTYSDFLQFGNPAQKDITITKEKVGPLKTTPIWLSPDDLDFIKFAEWFATNASILSATQANGIPSIYKSDSGKFVIHYHTKIRNRDGSYASTPARIGHDTGEIDVSQQDFMNYTIPGRMAILLHEYCHKYVNESTGLKMTDEIGADINALNIYLSLGYSPVEAHLVFLSVFETANNEYNHMRYKALTDFINKFLKGELKRYYKTVSDNNIKTN